MTEVVSVEAHGPLLAREALERCVAAGGVAIFPADTLYGLACDPTNAVAVARIDAIKRRDPGKPSAVLYFSPLAMRELLPSLGERSRAAVAALLPGPVTLLLANPEHRYPLACGADPERLGVRLIEGPLAGASFPVLQTSANRTGEPPADVFELVGALVDEVDLAIDGGALGGAPSTVVDLGDLDRGGDWRILREGALPAAEVATALAEES